MCLHSLNSMEHINFKFHRAKHGCDEPLDLCVNLYTVYANISNTTHNIFVVIYKGKAAILPPSVSLFVAHMCLMHSRFLYAIVFYHSHIHKIPISLSFHLEHS